MFSPIRLRVLFSRAAKRVTASSLELPQIEYFPLHPLAYSQCRKVMPSWPLYKSYLTRVIHITVADNSYLVRTWISGRCERETQVQYTSSPGTSRYRSKWRKSVLNATKSAIPSTSSSQRVPHTRLR